MAGEPVKLLRIEEVDRAAGVEEEPKGNISCPIDHRGMELVIPLRQSSRIITAQFQHLQPFLHQGDKGGITPLCSPMCRSTLQHIPELQKGSEDIRIEGFIVIQEIDEKLQRGLP